MKILKNRLFIGALCIVMAVLIGFIAVPLMMSITNQKVQVVRARDDIIKSTLITGDMVEITEMFSSDIPPGAARTVSEVVGQYAATSISKNDLFFTEKFSEEFPYPDQSLYVLGGAEYAVSVSTNTLPASVAGKVRPGDIVTILVTFGSSDMTIESKAYQPPELRYMELLAVTNSSGIDIAVEDVADGDSGGNTIPYTVTLRCNLEQAQLLAGYEANARVHLALAARAETEKARDCMERQAEYFYEPLEEQDMEEEEEPLPVTREEEGEDEEEDEEEESSAPTYYYRPPASEPEPEPEPASSEPSRPFSIFDNVPGIGR